MEMCLWQGDVPMRNMAFGAHVHLYKYAVLTCRVRL